jgi:cytochrome oxidase Cu insertion factor (SCO1/SenC/PrrC family)
VQESNNYQKWPLLLLGALLRVSTSSEELVFNKNKQQYTVSWGFVFRRSYKLNGSFQVAVDQFPPDPKSQSAINDLFITLIDKRGRRFPLGRFSEEDAERLVEELKKWQEDYLL